MLLMRGNLQGWLTPGTCIDQSRECIRTGHQIAPGITYVFDPATYDTLLAPGGNWNRV